MAETKATATVIGSDTIIKGEMSVESSAKILGTFEGNIKAKGGIEVADKAKCKATIETAELQVDGGVEGNITATSKVTLNSTANVNGDLVAAKLVVAEGAAFTGHVNVGPNAIKGGASSGSGGGSGSGGTGGSSASSSGGTGGTGSGGAKK